MDPNFRNYRINNQFYMVIEEMKDNEDIILSLTPRKRLHRLLNALLDENEFLSRGIRSVSKIHENPYTVKINGDEYGLKYEPGESANSLFGGNSNWRGPVWMPMNYMLVQSLRTLFQYYGNSLISACPAGGDSLGNLDQIADDISKGLISLFKPDENGRRPVHGDNPLYQNDPHFKDLVLFYEYFHGDNGRGIGASHQTGWTGLVAELIDKLYKRNHI